MRKRWWVAGVAVLAIAGIGSAIGRRAHSASQAEAKKKAADAVVALEFTPAEVVRPMRVVAVGCRGEPGPGRPKAEPSS